MKFSRQNNVNHISATQVVTQIVVFDPDTFVNDCVFSTHPRLSTPVCAMCHRRQHEESVQEILCGEPDIQGFDQTHKNCSRLREIVV